VGQDQIGSQSDFARLLEVFEAFRAGFHEVGALAAVFLLDDVPLDSADRFGDVDVFFQSTISPSPATVAPPLPFSFSALTCMSLPRPGDVFRAEEPILLFILTNQEKLSQRTYK